jgi:hypothetical protein
MNETEPIQKIRVKTVLVTIGIVAIVLTLATIIVIYFFPRNHMISRIRTVLPFPAIIINGTHTIVFHDIDTDLASIRRFYESQSDDLSKAGIRIDFSTPDGEKRLMIREKELLNKMVEDVAIRMLAQDRNIVVTQDEVSRAVSQKISALGNNQEDVSKKLNTLYGWTMTDFERKIVQPEIYKDELTKVYMQSVDTSTQAKKQIEEANKSLKQGDSFQDVAKKYSEGQTAQENGELGWIPVSLLAPEISQAIQKQKIDQLTDVVESPLGFHIVAVEERKQEQGQEIVRLKQIFTRKITFSDWLTQQMKQMNIVVLFKGYMWDKETARIEFKQPDMKDFEADILQKSQGDASVLF